MSVLHFLSFWLDSVYNETGKHLSLDILKKEEKKRIQVNTSKWLKRLDDCMKNEQSWRLIKAATVDVCKNCVVSQYETFSCFDAVVTLQALKQNNCLFYVFKIRYI